jgi:GntR family transcriptional regulator
MPLSKRDVPVPLYHQVKTALLREIEAGRWAPGDQLPTENALIARFHVSKITVRQALAELAQMGYIRREQGRGTFAQRPPLEEGPRELTSFTGEMRGHGLVASSRVLQQGIVPAPLDVADALLLARDSPVFRLRRLRLAEREPMGLQTSFIPLHLAPGIDALEFENASLYEILATRYALHAATARETHRAVRVSREDAALLRVPAGSPALAAERLTRLNDGRPLEYVQSIMRGDRYKIVLDLARPGR